MHQVSGYEKEIKKQEEQKNKIRERYKGIDRNELEFIPAKPREKLFEDTAEKRHLRLIILIINQKRIVMIGTSTDKQITMRLLLTGIFIMRHRRC